MPFFDCFFDVCVFCIKLGSHWRSDQLDQARSSVREPVWQVVVRVVGIDRASYAIKKVE